MIVLETVPDVVENEAPSQIADTLLEQPVKPRRGTEPCHFDSRHDVGKIGRSIQDLEVLVVVRDGNCQVDAIALQQGDLVLPRAELIRRGHALQQVHGHFHHETVGISQAVKMLEEIAGFVV